MRFLTKKGLYDSGRVLFLPVEDIAPNPGQPRTQFSQPELEELAGSIRALGLLQPLTVRRGEGGWELVAGERRLRAAKLAGLQQVPCLSVQADGQTSSLFALVENLQRRDLDFWEEALALRRLQGDFALSQEELARRLGKSQSAIANKLRLLKLPQEVLSALRDAGCTERHARSLLRLPDGEQHGGPGGVYAPLPAPQKAPPHPHRQGCAPLPEHHLPQPGCDALGRGGRPVPAPGRPRRHHPDHSHTHAAQNIANAPMDRCSNDPWARFVLFIVPPRPAPPRRGACGWPWRARPPRRPAFG